MYTEEASFSGHSFCLRFVFFPACDKHCLTASKCTNYEVWAQHMKYGHNIASITITNDFIISMFWTFHFRITTYLHTSAIIVYVPWGGVVVTKSWLDIVAISHHVIRTCDHVTCVWHHMATHLAGETCGWAIQSLVWVGPQARDTTRIL